MKKIMIYPNCPKCNSPQTGMIKCANSWYAKMDAKALYRSLAHGEYIKYVDGKSYANYYQPYGINMYCEMCGYEFKGNPYKEEKDADFIEEYQISRGCLDRLETAKEIPFSHKKKIQQFIEKKILKRGIQYECQDKN